MPSARSPRRGRPRSAMGSARGRSGGEGVALRESVAVDEVICASTSARATIPLGDRGDIHARAADPP